MNVGIEEVVPSVDSNTVLKLTPAEEEQVYEEIKKMENISVDQVKKSVSTNAYDEFAAYYYLISDKLFHKREAMAKEHLHEDKVPITPKVAPNEIPIDDVRERILHTERYYHTGLFAGLRGKKKQKTNGSGNKVHPIGGTVAVVTPTSGKDKDKDAPATPSPTTLSPDRQGQNAATLPRKHSVSPMSLRRSLDDRLPPLAVYLLASVTTVVSPREIIKRLVITLTRDLGMSPVLPAVLEQRSAIDVLISGLSLDKALLRLPEGAKYFFGATPDLPWTVRVIEKSEVTGEIGQELDVEVCRVLRFRKTFGVKFRRRGGDAWRFQELCRTIARKMNLG